MSEKYDIGVLGVWSGCNYGSVLTYYGLHETLKSLGYSVLMVAKFNVSANDPEKADTHSMRFAKAHYDISKNYALTDISELNDLCDTFIVGSDQLWNYGISRNFGKAYYLDFADDDKRKISYATSFGHTRDFAPPEERKIISGYMKRFDAISVREKDGVRLCRDIYGIKATQVVDPILLCGKSLYEKLSAKSSLNETEPYVLTYILDPTPEKREAILYIAEHLGLRLINILDGLPWGFENNKKALDLDGTMANVQSEDFLYLYRKAQFVITDSFHGTVCALLFNKPFVSIGNERRGVSRFDSLFAMIGNKDRYTTDAKTIIGNKKIFNRPNYLKINFVLEAKRRKSLEWLKKALGAPKDKLPSVALTASEQPLFPYYGTTSYENKKNEPYFICPKNACTGCAACYNACASDAITMQADSEGFLYPIINERKCTKCGKCERTCPVLNPTEKIKANKPPIQSFAAYSLDNEVRYMSTSGGAFSEFAKAVFALGGVCYGAAYDDKFVVRHVRIDTLNDLPKIRQSKYYQSEIGGIYKQVLDDLKADKWVLFCGAPCQTAGLSGFLRQDYNKLLIVDFICHSVSSPKVFHAYLDEKEKEYGGTASRVWFKNKEKGWHNFSQRIDFKNKSDNEYYIRHGWYNDAYMLGFLKYRCFQRPSCYECSFKECKRSSDITLADYWGLTWKNPEQAGSQENGVSAIVIHTKKGEKMFNEYVKQNMYAEEHSIEDIGKSNGGMYHSQRVGLYRDFFFTNLDTQPYSKIIASMEKREAELQAEREKQAKAGGIFGKLTKIGNVVINMHPTAKIVIKEGGELICNSHLPQGSNKECVLILHENATLNVNGKFRLVYDSVLQIFPHAILTLNSGFINAGATFAVKGNSVIGNDFLCGRHFVFQDSDFHQIIDLKTDTCINASKRGITIGEHVWCGEGVTILKDVTVGGHSVIGSKAVVTKDVPANVVVVGCPAKVVKENMDWRG
jgi:acetyltransferase-like isoleucine patch superfamily enzyme/coenzyme F420-reducing hydrogenase beta subunit/polysaccharide pyruvyl transferase WcaK-like protein